MLIKKIFWFVKKQKQESEKLQEKMKNEYESQIKSLREKLANMQDVIMLKAAPKFVISNRFRIFQVREKIPGNEKQWWIHRRWSQDNPGKLEFREQPVEKSAERVEIWGLRA